MLEAICVLELGIKAKDLGYLRAHHNGFSFYSYTVLTLLNTSVFVLVTAASSITIAALSALSNLFSFIWGAWNSSGFSLLCRDHWYSGPMQYFKNDRIKRKGILHLYLCCHQFHSSSNCVVLFCMQTFNSIKLKSVLPPT